MWSIELAVRDRDSFGLYAEHRGGPLIVWLKMPIMSLIMLCSTVGGIERCSDLSIRLSVCLSVPFYSDSVLFARWYVHIATSNAFIRGQHSIGYAHVQRLSVRAYHFATQYLVTLRYFQKEQECDMQRVRSSRHASMSRQSLMLCPRGGGVIL